jgi:hypothetical protein
MLNQISLACYTQGHKNQIINSETWSVSELYCSFLSKMNTSKIARININIREDWGELLDYYEKYANVIIIRNYFDFGRYSKLDRQGKKRMQLDIIHKSMMQIAVKEGWEIDSLLDAYNMCLQKNLEYQFEVRKLKPSRDKKYKIGFWCNWDIDVFEVFWVLYDKYENEIKREKFIEKNSFEGEFIYYAKFNWLDSQTVVFEDKYKYGTNEVWEISPFK